MHFVRARPLVSSLSAAIVTRLVTRLRACGPRRWMLVRANDLLCDDPSGDRRRWVRYHGHINRITEGLQLRTHCELLTPPTRLYFRGGNRMKKSTARMLAGIGAVTMGITACGSGDSSTTTITTTAASAATRVPTSYVDKNGFACARSQASRGYCPEDPASKPHSQPADSRPSFAASSTVAASSAPAPPPSPSMTAPAAAPSTPSGCYPLSDEGTCYEPGEYCRDSDHGASGVAGDGESIVCEDNDGWRWEPV
jgi:hypothetical protein